MNTFVVRIELHSSDYYPDFEQLHKAMFAAGFSKQIKADSGQSYLLPRGEYYIITTKSSDQVLNAAVAAMNTTGESGEILVTRSAGVHWRGLALAR